MGTIWGCRCYLGTHQLLPHLSPALVTLDLDEKLSQKTNCFSGRLGLLQSNSLCERCLCSGAAGEMKEAGRNSSTSACSAADRWFREPGSSFPLESAATYRFKRLVLRGSHAETHERARFGVEHSFLSCNWFWGSIFYVFYQLTCHLNETSLTRSPLAKKPARNSVGATCWSWS